MNIKLMDLIAIQQEVNEKVMEKLDTSIMGDQFILAFNVELFEYFNAVGIWKWWKHNHVLDKEKVLDELADCFAFFLSAIELEASLAILEDKFDFIEDVEKDMNRVFLELENFQADNKIEQLITQVGSDNESAGEPTIVRFTYAIYIATVLLEGIRWYELPDAYKKKSAINIQRQEENY